MATIVIPTLPGVPVPWGDFKWTLGSITLGSVQKYPCSFCDTPTPNAPHPKHGWRVCSTPVCQAAQTAQAERLYAGLVDCPETRRSALEWVQANAADH